MIYRNPSRKVDANQELYLKADKQTVLENLDYLNSQGYKILKEEYLCDHEAVDLRGPSGHRYYLMISMADDGRTLLRMRPRGEESNLRPQNEIFDLVTKLEN